MGFCHCSIIFPKQIWVFSLLNWVWRFQQFHPGSPLKTPTPKTAILHTQQKQTTTQRTDLPTRPSSTDLPRIPSKSMDFLLPLTPKKKGKHGPHFSPTSPSRSPPSFPNLVAPFRLPLSCLPTPRPAGTT